MRTSNVPTATKKTHTPRHDPRHDPRQDPKVGDIIAKASADRLINRIVAGRDGMMIQYLSKEGGVTKVCNLKAWRDWALDAVVIVTAD